MPKHGHALTVGMLKDRLQEMDDDLLVLLDGPEGGLAPLRHAEVASVVLNVNDDPAFGRHERAPSEAMADARALLLLYRQGSDGVTGGAPDDLANGAPRRRRRPSRTGFAAVA